MEVICNSSRKSTAKRPTNIYRQDESSIIFFFFFFLLFLIFPFSLTIIHKGR